MPVFKKRRRHIFGDIDEETHIRLKVIAATHDIRFHRLVSFVLRLGLEELGRRGDKELDKIR